MSGSFEALRVNVGTNTERIVVAQADDEVLASAELVAEMLDPDNPWTFANGRRVQFGTEGEGVGVVVYEVSDEPTNLAKQWYTLRRVSCVHPALVNATTFSDPVPTYHCSGCGEFVERGVFVRVRINSGGREERLNG